MNLRTSVIILSLIVIGIFLTVFVIPFVDEFETINCITAPCNIPKITIMEKIQQILGWEISVGFDDLAWILPTIALIITIITFTVAQWKTKKLESVKLILNIESRFLQPENNEVSKRMNAYISKKISFDVGKDVDDKNRRDLYNYLSEISSVSVS